MNHQPGIEQSTDPLVPDPRSPWSTSGSQAVLYDRRNGQAHVLNGSAPRLWELCDGERTIDQVTTQFLELQHAGRVVRRDVERSSRRSRPRRPLLGLARNACHLPVRNRPPPLSGTAHRRAFSMHGVGISVVTDSTTAVTLLDDTFGEFGARRARGDGHRGSAQLRRSHRLRSPAATDVSQTPLTPAALLAMLNAVAGTVVSGLYHARSPRDSRGRTCPSRTRAGHRRPERPRERRR